MGTKFFHLMPNVDYLVVSSQQLSVFRLGKYLQMDKSKLGDILGIEECVQIVSCRVSYKIFLWGGKNDACGTIFPRGIFPQEVCML